MLRDSLFTSNRSPLPAVIVIVIDRRSAPDDDDEQDDGEDPARGGDRVARRPGCPLPLMLIVELASWRASGARRLLRRRRPCGGIAALEVVAEQTQVHTPRHDAVVVDVVGVVVIVEDHQEAARAAAHGRRLLVP